MPAIKRSYPETDDDSRQQQQLVYSPKAHFYPGVYSRSGFDLIKILFHVATRPNPVIDLGPVDASCPIVLCDLFLPDAPAVYASDSFLDVTGYSRDEILGRNCRFLQNRPPHKTLPRPSSSSSSGEARSVCRSAASSLSLSSASASSSAASEPSTSLISYDDDKTWRERLQGDKSADDPRRQLLHNSVVENKEVQVEITNFRKDGSRWENRLTIVPIPWDDDGGCVADSSMLWHMDGMSQHRPRYRYAVGFACDRIAMGM